MPQSQYMFFAPVEPAKHSPILKISSGIGDTDGFPAFDSESDNYASVDDPKWGFRITGGAEFHMPITVFQVSAKGLACTEGIELGDIILEINEVDTKSLTLSQAQELINSTNKKLHLVARSMDEMDVKGKNAEIVDKFVTLRVPKPPPPKEFTPTPLLGSRMWHPVMWQDPPPPPKPKKTKIDIDGEEITDSEEDEEDKELPHHRIIRNIRRFFTETSKNDELRNKHLEDMLLILPGASKSK